MMTLLIVSLVGGPSELRGLSGLSGLSGPTW